MNYIKKMKQDLDRLQVQLANAIDLVARLDQDIDDLEKILDKVKSLG